jgi:hypothetical protein
MALGLKGVHTVRYHDHLLPGQGTLVFHRMFWWFYRKWCLPYRVQSLQSWCAHPCPTADSPAVNKTEQRYVRNKIVFVQAVSDYLMVQSSHSPDGLTRTTKDLSQTVHLSTKQKSLITHVTTLFTLLLPATNYHVCNKEADILVWENTKPLPAVCIWRLRERMSRNTNIKGINMQFCYKSEVFRESERVKLFTLTYTNRRYPLHITQVPWLNNWKSATMQSAYCVRIHNVLTWRLCIEAWKFILYFFWEVSHCVNQVDIHR